MDPFFFNDFMTFFAPLFIGAVFLIVFGTILYTIISSIREWHKNEQSPKLTVPAIIKAKRMNVRGGSAGNNNASSHTTYFVTFEFDSGDRLELRVSGKEYGLLSENDQGMVSFQGTRFLGFEREKQLNESV